MTQPDCSRDSRQPAAAEQATRWLPALAGPGLLDLAALQRNRAAWPRGGKSVLPEIIAAAALAEGDGAGDQAQEEQDGSR